MYGPIYSDPPQQKKAEPHGRAWQRVPLPFWKWAIDHELLLEEEALRALCYTAI